jgi:hypothetical protein
MKSLDTASMNVCTVPTAKNADEFGVLVECGMITGRGK